MRAYKFLNQKFGLKSLYERRLRRTKINELNDPFELRPFDLSNANERWAFHNTRRQLSQHFGLLCFSANWDNPVIWAHYSDRHRGFCLGFEIPPETAKGKTKEVDYISAPIPFPSNFLHLEEQQQLPLAEKMIFTKYEDWHYENEIRTWTDLEEEFFNFCNELQLVEVMIGAESPVSVKKITQALGSMADRVKVTKVRAAHNVFRMEEDI
jgi:hypothetical protein